VTMDSIRTVAVLGAGTMGNGIAHVFARAGYKVILRDVERKYLERAMDTISKNLDREVKKGKIDEAEKGSTFARLQPVVDMSAIAVADFAVEAVPEKIEIKRAVLSEADKILREGVVITGKNFLRGREALRVGKSLPVIDHAYSEACGTGGLGHGHRNVPAAKQIQHWLRQNGLDKDFDGAAADQAVVVGGLIVEVEDHLAGRLV